MSHLLPNLCKLYCHQSLQKILNPKLSVSGYRKFTGINYELLVDVGNLGPDYIPGHAHCDIFNFELYIHSKPVIVDTGTSTYEQNTRRMEERGTKSHNTVVLGNFEQSEIWASHRVGRRARTIIKDENVNHVAAEHNGYERFGIIHQRTFLCTEHQIEITDYLDRAGEFSTFLYLHFYPGIKITLINNTIVGEGFQINFQGNNYIKLNSYKFSPEFNVTLEAPLVMVEFTNHLKTVIHFEDIIHH